MEFYDKTLLTAANARPLPVENGDAFVAYHGSWNRTEPGGYCVTRVLFDAGRPYGELKVADFLGPNRQVIGRPVDVCQAADGSVLISDDHGNRIFRLRAVANTGN
jgi:glucose/arabinose dehydrogenase